MRKNLFLLPALLLVASALFVPSCTKDCKFKQADYLGTYSLDEDCSASAPAIYNVTIIAGATDTEVKISKVWDRFVAGTVATIDCETITIARQQPDNDNFFVEGSGFIEKADGRTTITMSYTVTDETVPGAINSDNCSQTVFVKQ